MKAISSRSCVLIILFFGRPYGGQIEGPAAVAPTANISVEPSNHNTDTLTDHQQAKKEGLERSERLDQERIRGGARAPIPLPNWLSGPGLPPPLAINFYEERNHYPGYLLCRYDVYEHNYDETNERAWFDAALLQIRGLGPSKFPAVEWVAVAIRNRAELKGATKAAGAYKVGAVFRINEVFDPSHDLEKLIANSPLDRHPFLFDSSKPTPGRQNRWLIVESHARAKRTEGKPK
jgi:hypothetical protein